MKAIETSYKGNAYRSRTECAWAVLLDLAGIRFTYEPEKMGGYWPDFFLEDSEIYLEIKAANPTPEELHKGASVRNLVFLCGRPKPGWVNGQMQILGWSACRIIGPDRVERWQPKEHLGNAYLQFLLETDVDLSKAASRFASAWETVKMASDFQQDAGRIGLGDVAAALSEAFGQKEKWTPRTHKNF